jgi:iron complex transport system substrate-binding protein
MTAVRNGRIHPIDDIVVTRPGPRLVEGLEALIRAIHPDLAGQLPTPEPATSLAGLPAAA